MDIKAFAIDIDGTITDSNHSLYLESIFSLRWLIKFGYNVSKTLNLLARQLNIPVLELNWNAQKYSIIY